MRSTSNFGKRGAPAHNQSDTTKNGKQSGGFNLNLRTLAISAFALIAVTSWLTVKNRPNDPPSISSLVQSATIVKPGRYWVSGERLVRQTCPAMTCGVVGKLFFRESVDVKEVQGNWARISKYYTASCTNGVRDCFESS